MNKQDYEHIKIPGVDESKLTPEEAETVDLLKQLKLLTNPEDYPIKGDTGQSIHKNLDGSLSVVSGDRYPPRHVCQECGKLLDASDLLDYVCNKHGGVH